MTFSLKEDGRRLLVITLAAVIMALNINTFVHTGGLYPGGVSGLTLLIQRSAQMFFGVSLPYTLINLLLNAGPIYIGFRFIGKKLTLYTIYMLIVSSVLTDVMPAHVVTQDVLLIAVFGGMINGTVISLCLLSNANTGGTDFIALYLSKRSGMDSFNVILGVNVVILSAAGFLFGWDKAMYSIIFQFASTQVLHVLYRKYQQITLFIVTDFPADICRAITDVSRHGATVLHGEGAYEHTERAVVYSVVSAAEEKAVLAAIRRVDPKAFINLMRTQQIRGRFYQPPEK
ncbi:YitT family protein [Chordicoccus furentiruminis]|uniref:YitT family protein n=1 Tax=Chordicoccus furentiruminis TaxID=2709410 RepID=UPI0023A8F16D|nr:YitT family protein [Chordicoccus furentiruminis]